MTSSPQSKTVVGWGLNWKLKVSRFLVVDVVWMIGTKMVDVFEGAVRYTVGWVKMVTLLCVVACFNNMKIVCY